MLVDKTMVELSGTVCNKVGVSYTAFNTQANACFQPFQRYDHFILNLSALTTISAAWPINPRICGKVIRFWLIVHYV